MEAFLELENELGHRISVKMADVDDYGRIARLFGRKGWCSGEIKGGLRLPYAQRDDFDWSIIGARDGFTVKDNHGREVPCVSWRGRVYKRRDMDADEKKNMPAMTKYSRGANDDDIAAGHVVEGEGNFRYVTLVTFKGGGRIIEAYRKGQGGATPQSAPAAKDEPAEEIPPVAPEVRARMNAGPTRVTAVRPAEALGAAMDERSAIKAIYRINGFTTGMTFADHDDLRAVVAAVVDRVSPTRVLKSRVPSDWGKFTLDELNEYLRKPIFLEDWFDDRPFKPIPEPTLDALKEQVEAIEEKSPPPATDAPKAPKPPEKASKMLVFAIEEQAKKLGYSPDVMTAHVSDATSGRTTTVKGMYATEARDLLAFLRSLGAQD